MILWPVLKIHEGRLSVLVFCFTVLDQRLKVYVTTTVVRSLCSARIRSWNKKIVRCSGTASGWLSHGSRPGFRLSVAASGELSKQETGEV